MAMIVNHLCDLKHRLKLCESTVLNEDLKKLFQDELALLSKAADENTLNVEYIEGCRYRIERTMGMMHMNRTE
jgi:hypothetical protein